MISLAAAAYSEKKTAKGKAENKPGEIDEQPIILIECQPFPECTRWGEDNIDTYSPPQLPQDNPMIKLNIDESH